MNLALFYEQRRTGLGDEFLAAVDVMVNTIRREPELGKRGLHGTFNFRIKRFPFRVVYEVQPAIIWVVAVAHLSRRPGYWARRVD